MAAGRWEGSGRVQARMRSHTSRGHCRGTDGGRRWPRDRGVTIVTICAPPAEAASHGPHPQGTSGRLTACAPFFANPPF